MRSRHRRRFFEAASCGREGRWRACRASRASVFRRDRVQCVRRGFVPRRGSRASERAGPDGLRSGWSGELRARSTRRAKAFGSKPARVLHTAALRRRLLVGRRAGVAEVERAGRCGHTLEWRPRTWKADFDRASGGGRPGDVESLKVGSGGLWSNDEEDELTNTALPSARRLRSPGEPQERSRSAQ